MLGRMLVKPIAVLILAALPLTACADLSNEDIGRGAGAVGGAVIGSQFGGGSGRVAATALGAILGSYFGAYVGRRLDERDRAMMGNTTQQALDRAPNNQTLSWNNPDSGNSGTVTPTTNYSKSGAQCRDFTSTVNAGGQSDAQRGTACKQPDGSWQIVS